VNDYDDLKRELNGGTKNVIIGADIYIPEGVRIDIPTDVTITLPANRKILLDGELNVYGLLKGVGSEPCGNILNGGSDHGNKDTGKLKFGYDFAVNGNNRLIANWDYSWNLVTEQWTMKDLTQIIDKIEYSFNGRDYYILNAVNSDDEIEITTQTTLYIKITPKITGLTFAWRFCEGVIVADWKPFSNNSSATSNELLLTAADLPARGNTNIYTCYISGTLTSENPIGNIKIHRNI
jgi:hypothetical protein